ncbi:unnamed protein product [Urochloa humidicola]
MAFRSVRVRRRSSSSSGGSSTSPGVASSRHRNVRRRASSSLGSASSTPKPGRASSTPTPGRASSTPTHRRASFRLYSPIFSRLMKGSGSWNCRLSRRKGTYQKVLRASSESPARVHGRAYGSQIPDELYELFLSEKEEKKSSEFSHFFTSEPAVTPINVPGQQHGDQYLRFSDPARISCAALVDWQIMLKEAGYSLACHISASDFAITYFGYFKGKRTLLEKLRTSSPKLAKMNMSDGADLIENEICAGAAVLPAEVRHLIRLLRGFKKKNSFIIRHHPSLYNELGKEMLFSSMFGRAKKLQKLDPSKYQKIVGKLPYCRQKGKGNWTQRVRNNIYLKSVLTRLSPQQLTKKNPRKRKVQIAFIIRYKKNGGELLRFRRNSQQHLPDFSVDQSAVPTLTQSPAPAVTMKKKLPRSAVSAARSRTTSAEPVISSCHQHEEEASAFSGFSSQESSSRTTSAEPVISSCRQHEEEASVFSGFSSQESASRTTSAEPVISSCHQHEEEASPFSGFSSQESASRTTSAEPVISSCSQHEEEASTFSSVSSQESASRTTSAGQQRFASNGGTLWA